jgi:hypothetical protein
MQAQDMRTWLPQSPYDRSSFQVENEIPSEVSPRALRRLLDCAAFSGCSAFLDECFDFDVEH